MLTSRSFMPLILLCLGLALVYAIGLFSRSIWYDEAITLLSLSASSIEGLPLGQQILGELKHHLAGVTSFAGVVEHYRYEDVHPPLYFLISHVFTLLFGTDLYIVRTVSLLLVLGSVLVFARLLLRNDHRYPWIYALIYGLSFAVVTSAQDARGYALVLLLGVLAWKLLSEMPFHQGRARLIREVVLGLVCGGLLLTHYFAALLVIAISALHLLDAIFRRKPVALIAPCVATLVFLPWLPILFEHLQARPAQMTGFQGLVEWAKRGANLTAGQVFSATNISVPPVAQKLGRFAVMGLVLIGAISVLIKAGQNPRQVRIARMALLVPAIGLSGFLILSIAMDRWFVTLRYFIFFAPFIAYLAAHGALTLGAGLGRILGQLRMAPACVFLVMQAAMLNFGWETNFNRGGAYYDTIGEQIEEGDVTSTLVLIDPGQGRGTPLAAAHSLPEETAAFLLQRDPKDWASDASKIEALLDEVETVYLIFTIERGSMQSDKVALYGPLVDMLEKESFDRVEAQPINQGWRFYAKWSR